ncbi:MAG: hypothetical protein JXQ29_18620 [Planctomycetes bacterium]|nr:hypothetical protein [Planctomycetota bacterium]
MERDCGQCARDPALREQWGCDGPTAVPPHQVLLETADGGLETIRDCPLRLLRGSRTWEVLEFYTHYTAGFLPFDGPVDRQPRALMRLFGWIGPELERVRSSAPEKDRGAQINDARARAKALISKARRDDADRRP